MISFNERSIVSSVFFATALIVLVNSTEMQSDVALLPRIVGCIMLAMSGLQLCNDIFPAIRKRLSFLNKSASEAETFGGEGVIDETKEDKAVLRRRNVFIAWMTFFGILIYYVGMIWAIGIAMFVYLKWISKERWGMSILYPLVMAVVMYFIFVEWFDTNFFWKSPW